MPFEEQVVLIWAATNGHFDDVLPDEIAASAAALLDYLGKMHRKEIFGEIKTSGELSSKVEERLKTAIIEFKRL